VTEAQAAAGLPASAFLTDRAEIERVFRIFRDRCSPVQLRFGRAEDEYTARILEVTEKAFLLEDIRPRTGLKLMRNQEPFSLAGRVDGIYAHVDEMRVAETAEDRGVPYFVVKLPKEILYQQRRRAARFRLPLSVAKDGARLTLHRADRPLSGFLVDISAGGCRVVFDVKSDPQILQDEVVERSDIEIPHLLSLSTKTVIRHHSYNKQTGQLACGIEFSEMPVRDRRRLEQFIQKISKVADPL
jgi:c-di-GMP-binding flagellar brake protein YcgR